MMVGYCPLLIIFALRKQLCPMTADSPENISSPLRRATRFPAMFDAATMLLLFFAMQLAVSQLALLCGLVPPQASEQEGNLETVMNALTRRGEIMTLLYTSAMVLSLAAVGLYIRLRSGRRARLRLAAAGLNPNIILAGTLCVVAAQIVAEPLALLLPHIADPMLGRGFWACMTAIFFAPLLEETLCRGLVLEAMRSRWGNATAVAVSSLFFGALHVDPSAALPAFVVGLVLGSVYVRTSSLFSAVILHAINNAIAFALICFDVADTPLREMVGNDRVYWSLYAAALVVLALFGVVVWRRTSRPHDPAGR